MRGPWQHLSWMLMRHLAPIEKKEKERKKTHSALAKASAPSLYHLTPTPLPLPPRSQSDGGPPTGHFHFPSAHSGACRPHLPSPLPLYLFGASHCNTPALYRWRGGLLSITLHSFTLNNNRQLARILFFKHLFGGGASSVAAMCRRRRSAWGD